MFNHNLYRKHEISKTDVTALSKKDPIIASLIDYVGEIESYYIPDYFTSLVNQIVYQLINYDVATIIWKRLQEKIKVFTPQNILSFTQDEIKSVGLTRSKASYIHNIATAFIKSEINTNFDVMTDQEVMKEVQKIKGVGPWTSEMFLIFCLYRKNVFSYGDIAIRNAIVQLYNLDHDLTKEEFKTYAVRYSPFGTIASFYLWEITLRKIKKEDLQ